MTKQSRRSPARYVRDFRDVDKAELEHIRKLSDSVRDLHLTPMIERRAVGFKAFVGLITFDLVVMRGSEDAIQHVSSPNVIRFALGGAAVAGFLTLFLMLSQIEEHNAIDRGKYNAVRNELDRILFLTSENDKQPKASGLRGKWQTLTLKWAYTGPLFGSLVLTAGMLAFAWTLKTPDHTKVTYTSGQAFPIRTPLHARADASVAGLRRAEIHLRVGAVPSRL
jgi:hypothetical protein